MTVPANLGQESAPYGAAPVVPYGGAQGGPYTVRAPFLDQPIGSASRTAGISSSDKVNSQWKGLYVILTVTVNPGGAQTLELLVEGKDPILSTYWTLMDVPASAAPGGVFLIYPGLSGAPVDGVGVTRNLVLPSQWRVRTAHSGAGAWTYTVETIELL